MKEIKMQTTNRKMYAVTPRPNKIHSRTWDEAKLLASLTRPGKKLDLKFLALKRAYQTSQNQSAKTATQSMNKLAIIDQVYRSREYQQACRQITSGDQLSGDLFHETMVVLMKYDEAKIVGLYERGELKWFVVRVMMTMWRCKSSPFFQAYRKMSDSINERIQPMEDEYDLDRDIATQLILDVTDKVIEEKLNSGNRNDWYEATMWKLYLSAGSFRKAEALSKVPYKSISNTVRRMKLIIAERIKLEAGKKK